MGPTLTTKANKAKCLAYRDGKRCGRVAKFVVSYKHSRQSVCKECAERIVNEHAGRIDQESAKGFTVNVTRLGGMVSRRYIEIGA